MISNVQTLLWLLKHCWNSVFLQFLESWFTERSFWTDPAGVRSHGWRQTVAFPLVISVTVETLEPHGRYRLLLPSNYPQLHNNGFVAPQRRVPKVFTPARQKASEAVIFDVPASCDVIWLQKKALKVSVEQTKIKTAAGISPLTPVFNLK